jgi:hypothetical protein
MPIKINKEELKLIERKEPQLSSSNRKEAPGHV